MGYKNDEQRKAAHASMAEQKKGPGKKQDDIEIKKGNQGKFTAWVKKNMPGKDTCAAASAVMKNKKKYSSSVVKMANFAKNFGCAKK